MKNRSGFTLVELSIVLVIIGLLIGGILVAQSMIGTAKIQALIRETAQFDSAVENFVTKYNQLPGDSKLSGAAPGNNDGIISIANPDFMSGEPAKFWADLSVSGLANPDGGNFVDNSSDSNSGLATDRYAPKSTDGKNAYFLALGSGTAGTNYYFIAGANIAADTSINATTAFLPSDVLAFDTKIDDGVANTGNVKGADQNLTNSTSPSASILTGTTCANGATYAVTATTETCSIRARIGISTGNLH